MATHKSWLASLPEPARAEATRVRATVAKNVPDGYEETVSRNMLVWQVPLDQYPDTYNGEPLMFAALATGKSGFSLHLLPIYFDEALAEQLRAGFVAAGKKPDIGKGCVRFKKADDLALDVVGKIVGKISLKKFVATARAARATRARPVKKPARMGSR